MINAFGSDFSSFDGPSLCCHILEPLHGWLSGVEICPILGSSRDDANELVHLTR